MEAFQAQLSVSCHIEAAHENIPVLIVHADRHVRSYLRMLLRKAGVASIWDVASGAEVRAIYREYRPSLVFVGVLSSGRLSPEDLAQIRAADPRARVVAVTSADDPGSVAACSNAEVIGCVRIHLERDQILEMIRDALAAAAEQGYPGGLQEETHRRSRST